MLTDTMVPNRSERFVVQNRGLGYVARSRGTSCEFASVFVNPDLPDSAGSRLDPGPLIVAPIPDLLVPAILECRIQRNSGVISRRLVSFVIVLLAFLLSNFSSSSKPVVVVTFAQLMLPPTTVSNSVFGKLLKLLTSHLDFIQT